MAQRVPYDFWGARYPNLDRLFIALWYIPIGILLHGFALIANDPQAYSFFAEHSLLPIYRQFFETVVPPNVMLFAAAATLTELLLGILIISKGRFVKLGLLLSSILQIMLIPTTELGILNVLLAVMGLMLLRYDFDRWLFVEAVDYLRSRRQIHVPSPTS